MWIVLAVLTFLAGQLYLIHCLRKLDQFLNAQNQQMKNPPVEPADSSVDQVDAFG